jgi:DNA-binding transcriptional MerR regulator
MSGIRTHAAAEFLGVSPSTLRSWEQRFEYPTPSRTPGNHRQYDLAELEGLRQALQQTGDIAAAIEIARRGTSLPSPEGMLDSLDRFDEAAADRAMEESLAVRSVERTIEELLLPAVEAASKREKRAAEYEFACRWATAWLHSARRTSGPATRPAGVLLLDSSTGLGYEALHAQALELVLRRAGFRVLLLSTGLASDRVLRAVQALEPGAILLCGEGTTLNSVGSLVGTVRRAGAGIPLLAYRGATLISGQEGIASAGSGPSEAVSRLTELLQAARSRRADLPLATSGGGDGLSALEA